MFDKKEKVLANLNGKLSLMQKQVEVKIKKIEFAIKSFIEEGKFMNLNSIILDGVSCRVSYDYKNQVNFVFTYEDLFVDFVPAQYMTELNELIEKLKKEQDVLDVMTNEHDKHHKLYLRYVKDV
jgi:6-phosphogluconolactonase (cycloisomerase 2 family)